MLVSVELAQLQEANGDDIEDWFNQLSKNSPKYALPVRDAISSVDHHYPKYFNETTVDGWFN